MTWFWKNHVFVALLKIKLIHRTENIVCWTVDTEEQNISTSPRHHHVHDVNNHYLVLGDNHPLHVLDGTLSSSGQQVL